MSSALSVSPAPIMNVKLKSRAGIAPDVRVPGAPTLKIHAEQQLVQLAVQGNRDALSELLCRQAQIVRQKLSGKIGRRWRPVLDVDDIIQVSCMEAFLRIGQFQLRGPGSFDAWFLQIAIHNLRDAIKGLKRAKRPAPAKRIVEPVTQDSCVALVEKLGVTTTTASRRAATAEVHRRVSAVLEQLPADYAQVIRLYDLQQLTAAEVAERMKRSLGAVHMLRQRALEHLRHRLVAIESQCRAVIN